MSNNIESLSFGEKAGLGFLITKEKVVGKTTNAAGKKVEVKEVVFTFKITDLPNFKKPVGVSPTECARTFFDWALKQKNEHPVMKLMQNMLSSQIAVLLRGALTRLHNAGKTEATFMEVLYEYANSASAVMAKLTEAQLREQAMSNVLDAIIRGKLKLKANDPVARAKAIEDEYSRLKSATNPETDSDTSIEEE